MGFQRPGGLYVRGLGLWELTIQGESPRPQKHRQNGNLGEEMAFRQGVICIKAPEGHLTQFPTKFLPKWPDRKTYGTLEVCRQM